MTLSAKLCVNMIGSRRPNLLSWWLITSNQAGSTGCGSSFA